MRDEQLAEIEARAKAATPGPWTIDTQLGIDDPRSTDTTFVLHTRADVPALIAALRASHERERRYESLLRRYHERVTAADNLLTGIIASRGYLNKAMSELPHPTIGNEVSAALGEEAKS